MISTQRIDDLKGGGRSVVSVGSFDGVHRAHQQIINEMVLRARSIGGRSVVVTFDPHPRDVLRPDAPVEYLTPPEERRRRLGALGVDVLLEIPFTREFSRLTSREFIHQYLVQGLAVAEIIEGYNHHFGRDREGGTQALRQLGQEFGFTSRTVPQFDVDGEAVSSSAIRGQLTGGDAERAAQFLGREYGLRGIVVKGDQRGRTLGYPTANIAPEYLRQLMPANGIYVVGVDLEDGVRRFGLANIGIRPTFYATGPRLLEVFILDFDADIYGRAMTTTFFKRIRDEEKFANVQDLIRQMDVDTKDARIFLKDHQLNP